MSIQLRNVGHERYASPRIKRAAGVLSDGSGVLLIGDNNQTGVSGDGGDNTGVPKLYLYHSANRTSWTLKNTINITMITGIAASMAVDAANNIHLVWRSSSGTLVYKKLTFSAGPTWSAGSDVTVAAAPGTDAIYYGMDIDALGTSGDRVVVATYRNFVGSSRNTSIRAFVRRASDNTWIAQTVVTAMSSDSLASYSDDLSVSADQQAIGGDNIALFAVHATRVGALSGKDFGDVVYMYKTNVSTGATQDVRLAAGPFNAGRGANHRRKYWLYNSGNDQWLLAGTTNVAPWENCVFHFTWNRATNTRTALDIPVTFGTHGTVVQIIDAHGWAATAYNKADQTVAFFAFNSSYSYAAIAKIDVPGKKAIFYSGNGRWDDDYKTSGVVPPSAIWSGSHSRFTHGGAADTAIFFWKSGSTNAYLTRARSAGGMNAPANILPANLSLVATDRPLLSMDHKGAFKWSQFKYKAEWQLATNAGFSVNLRTEIGTDSDFVGVSLTLPPDNAKITSTRLVQAANELFQSGWFIRARSVSNYGYVGPWSSALSFTVAHPPVAANLSPTGGKVLVPALGDLITMSWSFSDPSPFDNQTAYQIVVENNETGSVIVDTGKIVSDLNQASVVIPAVNKNNMLRWKVRLWDSDDIDGPYSDNQLFFPTDGPVPTILQPTDGGVLNDGTPIISWDPGVVAAQVQTAYLVAITQGSQVLHNSGWQPGDNTAYQIPLGVLRNASSYSVTVRVRTNYDLENFQTVAFSTSWTPPATPTGLQVYLSEYAKRGFVWLVQDLDEVDPDFVKYNLYRRKYGDSEWTLVTEWSNAVQTPMVYRDYLIGSAENYQYTVTQVVDRFGDIMESTITAEQVWTIKAYSDRYWLLDTTAIESDSLPLYSVTADPFTDEYEQETYHVIGRGRHTDYGDRLGYSGAMSCQLRDRVSTGIEVKNHALNPAMQIFTAGGVVPDRWSIVQSGGATDSYAAVGHTSDPPPTGKILVPEVFVVAAPNTSIIQLQQQLELPELPLAVAGQLVTFSVWVYGDTPMGASTQWRLDLAVLNSSDTVLTSSGSHTLNPFEFYTSDAIGQPDYQNPTGPTVGVWRRLKVSVTWPAGAPAKLRYAVGARNNTGSAKTGGFRVTGAQVEIGDARPYTDGYQLGSVWLGEEGIAPSYTNGYYTARQQRLNLEEMKRRRKSMHVRTPFGDLFMVSTGNISVDRIAGTGPTEFTDVEIPYTEVYE